MHLLIINSVQQTKEEINSTSRKYITMPNSYVAYSARYQAYSARMKKRGKQNKCRWFILIFVDVPRLPVYILSGQVPEVETYLTFPLQNNLSLPTSMLQEQFLPNHNL